MTSASSASVWGGRGEVPFGGIPNTGLLGLFDPSKVPAVSVCGIVVPEILYGTRS